MGNESQSLAKCVCQAGLPLKKWPILFQSLESLKNKTERAAICWGRHVLSISFNRVSFLLTSMHLELLHASKSLEWQTWSSSFLLLPIMCVSPQKKRQLAFMKWEPCKIGHKCVKIWDNSMLFWMFHLQKLWKTVTKIYWGQKVYKIVDMRAKRKFSLVMLELGLDGVIQWYWQ